MTKPSNPEDEYFAREEAEKRRKAAIELQRNQVASERDAQKALHFMHCPKCGHGLETIHFKDVEIDKCFACNGSWLDAGELERLAGKEAGFLQNIATLFRSDK